MSLAALETAVVEYVADVLVNGCGRPIPDQLTLYHGGALPHACCTDNGQLSVDWAQEYPSTAFPALNTNDPCSGYLVTELWLRYVVCWPVAKTDPAGAPIFNEAFFTDCNAAAVMLANVADCVARALSVLECDPTALAGLALAARNAAGRRTRYMGAQPIRPQGGCAGVQWRLYSGVLP